MYVLPFLFFLSWFLALMAIGAVAIAGFFTITRGEEIVRADGSTKKVGKIFKGWFFFWFKKKPFKKAIWYKGKDLDEYFYRLSLVQELKEFIPRLVEGEDGGGIKINSVSGGGAKLSDKKVLIERLGTSFIFTGADDGVHTIIPYDEENVYVYPEWLRTVLAGCITCFSSIYGSIVYWVGIFLPTKEFINYIFGWSGSFILAVILFNIIFCLCLSYLLTRLWNKMK